MLFRYLFHRLQELLKGRHDTQHNYTQHNGIQQDKTLSIMAEWWYAECRLSWISLSQRVTYEPLMTNVIMLNVIMLSVITVIVAAPSKQFVIVPISSNKLNVQVLVENVVYSLLQLLITWPCHNADLPTIKFIITR